MMQTTAEKDLTSIGNLAAQLQASVRRIERAAIELNIAPALRLSGVPYFDGDQIELLREKLGGSK